MVKEDAGKKAEQELLKLRKLPENKMCANCLSVGVPLHTAVVVPFRIFVCSTCKSAHQSFSHRCKSSQMSIWTMDEVRLFMESNDGGNKVAQETWLAHVRDSDRPKEGDSLDRFKDFVRRAYIEERWKGERRRDQDRRDDPPPERSSRGSDGDGRSAQRRSGRAEAPPAAPRREAEPSAASAPAAAIDLFDAEPVRAAPTAATPIAGQAAPVATESFFDPFGAASPQQAQPLAPPQMPPQAQAPPPFQQPQPQTQAWPQLAGNAFDPFASSAPPAAAAAPQLPQVAPNASPMHFAAPAGSPSSQSQATSAPSMDPFDPFATPGSTPVAAVPAPATLPAPLPAAPHQAMPQTNALQTPMVSGQASAPQIGGSPMGASPMSASPMAAFGPMGACASAQPCGQGMTMGMGAPGQGAAMGGCWPPAMGACPSAAPVVPAPYQQCPPMGGMAPYPGGGCGYGGGPCWQQQQPLGGMSPCGAGMGMAPATQQAHPFAFAHGGQAQPSCSAEMRWDGQPNGQQPGSVQPLRQPNLQDLQQNLEQLYAKA